MNLISDEEFKLELKRVMLENPDSINPQGDLGCAYTIEDKHCVVGQMAVNMEWNLPDEDGMNNTTGASLVALEYGWPLEMTQRIKLNNIQKVADGISYYDKENNIFHPIFVATGPRPWGEVWDMISDYL